MSRIINGVLYVESFLPTGNLGEYTFESALFNNQADATGNGAYDIAIGFVIFVQAVDINTSAPIPGVFHRYKLTSVNPLDSVRISGTILWDEQGDEVDSLASNVFCMLSQTTQNLKIAIPPVDSFYPDIIPGSTITAMLNDLINIMDKLSSGAAADSQKTPIKLLVSTNGQTEFTLPNVPKKANCSDLYVNGVRYVYGVEDDYVISNNVLTWTNNSFVLEMSDTVVISYAY